MAKDTPCFHCGEDCDEEIIILEDKPFCCNGCKMVYQLLSENNLEAYYQLENAPGTSIKKLGNKEQYAYLEIPEAQEKLLDFSENGISKITFGIPSIHCSSCVFLLENLSRIHQGVKTVVVDFIKRQASITFNHDIISLRALVELLVSIGYRPDLTKNKEEEKNVKPDRSLAFKIGLAGFCFGNVMLLSFPEYLTINEAILAEYKPFFGYLNFILALPVLFYASQDYFVSAWAGLKQRIVGIDVPIVIGIVSLFGRSTYEIISQTGAGYMDSFTGLIFFLLVGKWYQSKTYQALSFERDYTAYFPMAITKIDAQNQENYTLIQKLQQGDIIKIRNQEIIPTDSILLSETAAIDYSFVSGESEAIAKQKGDKIYAGGRQMGGAIRLEIQKKVNQSYFVQLWNQRIFDKDKTAVLSETVNVISRYFTFAILSIAFSTLVYWFFVDSSKALLAFSSVLIIACPCALALAAPFAFGNMLRLFGREGFFLKNTFTVEQLSGITDIVFDKTGTLTTNNPTNISFEGKTLSPSDELYIKSLVQHSTHPLSQMLFKYLKSTTALFVISDYKELEGKGIEGYWQGELIQIGSASFVGAFAQKSNLNSQVYVSVGGEIWGYFAINKEYRSGINTVLESLEQNFKLHLLSGDNDAEKATLQTFFDRDKIHFNQAPLDKLNYIKNIQKDGKKILMVGDGLNDAGALQQAEVGIALSNDVYSFSPASDAILDAQKFNHLHEYIQMAKQSLSIVKASFVLSLLYNSVGLYFAIQGLLTPLIAAILMPLSSISVVLFVTIMTNGLNYSRKRTKNKV